MQTNFSLSGLAAVLFALSVWSWLVIYYTFFSKLPPMAICSYRIVWSVVFTVIAITAMGRWHGILATLRDLRRMKMLVVCGLLMGMNLFAFIAAISAGKAVEASIGGYLTPMLGLLASMIYFKESVDIFKKVAVFLVILGILYMIWGYGKIPWYAFGISIPFMIYNVFHKILKMNMLDGFFIEMCVLLLPSLLYLTFAPDVTSFFYEPLYFQLLIVFLGPSTAFSGIAFNYGVMRLPLSTVSVLQYLYPTAVFFIGLYYFNEPLGRERLIVFCFIWAGVVLYVLDSIWMSLLRKRKS